VEANRTLARQLLAAADAWLFVTTAARYADAVPVGPPARRARPRHRALARAQPRARTAPGEIAPHLRRCSPSGPRRTRAAGRAREPRSRRRPLPAAALAPGARLARRARADGEARSDSSAARSRRAGLRAAARRRVAARSPRRRRRGRARADGDQRLRAARSTRSTRRAQRHAAAREVLARWHEVVGTGRRHARARVAHRLAARPRARAVDRHARREAELRRRGPVERRRGRARRGRPGGGARRRRVARQTSPGRALLEGTARSTPRRASCRADRGDRARVAGHVFDLVREEGADKRTTARLPRSASTAPG
jgi:hypothetical protein